MESTTGGDAARPAFEPDERWVPVDRRWCGLDRRSIAPQADLWVIPVEQRAVAETHGPMVVFCEVPLPHRLFANGTTSPLIKRRHPVTLHFLDRIRKLDWRNDISARLFADSLTESLRLDLIEASSPPAHADWETRSELNDDDKRRLLEHLDTDGIEVDVSLAALADHVGMPIGAFARAFAATFHTTPRQFVLDHRIARAKTILLTTGLSITEISANTGFSTHSHFSTAFKNRVGMTPRQFRIDGTAGSSRRGR